MLIGHFRSIKIQLDSKAWRTQTTETNKHVIQFPLFLSSRPHCQAEFQFIEISLLQRTHVLREALKVTVKG